MPSIIDRYLAREIGLTLLATTLALMAIILSHRLAIYLSKVANGLLSRDSIFLLLGLQAIELLVVFLPLAFLLSIMLTLGRLYRDHEMAALAACGYGPLSVYRAAFILAVPLSLLTGGLSLYLLPITMELQFEALAKARKEAEVSMFTPGTFREVLNGQHVVYIGALSGTELHNVFIQSRESNGDLSVTTGQQGHQEVGADGIRHIILDHGYRYRGQPGHNNYEMIQFERAILRVDTAPPPESWQHRETVPVRQLWRASEPRLQAELQMRFNSPVQILIIALWAPPLARTQPRQGRYGRVVAAVLLYAINFNLIGIAESWLSHGTVGPFIGLWWVHGLFLLLGVGLLLQHHRGGQGFWPFRAASPAGRA